MAKILHVEDDLRVRRKVANILEEAGHRVLGISEVPSVGAVIGQYDLYICGQMGKYSDGLSFATDMRILGARVVVLAHKRKYSRVPFVDTATLRQRGAALASFEQILARD